MIAKLTCDEYAETVRQAAAIYNVVSIGNAGCGEQHGDFVDEVLKDLDPWSVLCWSPTAHRRYKREDDKTYLTHPAYTEGTKEYEECNNHPSLAATVEYLVHEAFWEDMMLVFSSQEFASADVVGRGAR